MRRLLLQRSHVQVSRVRHGSREKLLASEGYEGQLRVGIGLGHSGFRTLGHAPRSHDLSYVEMPKTLGAAARFRDWRRMMARVSACGARHVRCHEAVNNTQVSESLLVELFELANSKFDGLRKDNVKLYFLSYPLRVS